MALGANDHKVVRMFVGQAGIVVGIGVAVGILGSTALTQMLASQLFGVTTSDALTYVGASVLLSSAALVAVWIPARRAAGTDPMAVLRQ